MYRAGWRTPHAGQHIGQVFGGKAMTGAYDPHAGIRQHFSFGDIGDREYGAPKHQAGFFALRPGVVDIPERSLGIPHIRDQPRQLVGFQSEGAVRPAVGAAERDVLLDRRGTQRDGGGRDGRSQGVV